MLCFHVGKRLFWAPAPLRARPSQRHSARAVWRTEPRGGGGGCLFGDTVPAEQADSSGLGVGSCVVVARCTLGSNGAS